MLLEKVSNTEILFVHCYKFFFIITCSFSVFVENCILLPKGINEFVVFLCIVHVWFWFFTLLPIFLLLVIKGQFFPRTTVLFQSAFFFSYKNVASKSFYKSRIHLFPLMLMQRNEMWYTYGVYVYHISFLWQFQVLYDHQPVWLYKIIECYQNLSKIIKNSKKQQIFFI